MRFSQIRRTIAKYAAAVLLVYVVLVVLVVTSPIGRNKLDEIAAQRVTDTDQKMKENANKGKWKPFKKLGNISRHHRYAQYKTQVWLKDITQDKKLSKSHIRWANKNKRNIPMQLQLAAYYDKQGEYDKSFKLLQRLYKRVPNHLELAAAYQQAIKRRGHQIPLKQTDLSIEEYFK